MTLTNLICTQDIVSYLTLCGFFLSPSCNNLISFARCMHLWEICSVCMYVCMNVHCLPVVMTLSNVTSIGLERIQGGCLPVVSFLEKSK